MIENFVSPLFSAPLPLKMYCKEIPPLPSSEEMLLHFLQINRTVATMEVPLACVVVYYASVPRVCQNHFVQVQYQMPLVWPLVTEAEQFGFLLLKERRQKLNEFFNFFHKGLPKIKAMTFLTDKAIGDCAVQENICNTRPGGYLGFQVMGMIEQLFGFEIFDSGIFWIQKFCKYFFL